MSNYYRESEEAVNNKRVPLRTRNDLVLIGAVLIVAVALLLVIRFTGKTGAQIQLTVDGARLAQYPLDTDVGILLVPGQEPVILTELDGYSTSQLEGLTAEDIKKLCPDRSSLLEGNYNLILIREQRADMVSASCPDKICVKQHGISRTGEAITCLPNKTVITVTGASGDDTAEIDYVSQ